MLAHSRSGNTDHTIASEGLLENETQPTKDKYHNIYIYVQIYFTDVVHYPIKLAGREACTVRLGRVRAQGRPMDNLIGVWPCSPWMDGYLGAFSVVGSRQLSAWQVCGLFSCSHPFTAESLSTRLSRYPWRGHVLS